MSDVFLHHIEKGTGPALILLHGNGEDSGHFSKQIEELSDEYRVIAVDTRGHGNTPRGTAPFTLEQFADDLDSFMDCMNIDTASILGFSDGGNIAILFALKYPRRIEKLILNGANLRPCGMKIAINLSTQIAYLIATVKTAINNKNRSEKEMLALMAKQPKIRTEDLKKLSMPVLVIAGDQDMIRKIHTEKISNTIPDSELCIMEGDHFIAYNNSKNFNLIIRKFLRG